MPAITLDADEALVLFDAVSRWTNTDHVAIEHPAERVAIWNLTGALEKVLVEPFRKDYADLLHAARVRLAAGIEDSSTSERP